MNAKSSPEKMVVNLLRNQVVNLTGLCTKLIYFKTALILTKDLTVGFTLPPSILAKLD
jgi:hypothetical protein